MAGSSAGIIDVSATACFATQWRPNRSAEKCVHLAAGMICLSISSTNCFFYRPIQERTLSSTKKNRIYFLIRLNHETGFLFPQENAGYEKLKVTRRVQWQSVSVVDGLQSAETQNMNCAAWVKLSFYLVPVVQVDLCSATNMLLWKRNTGLDEQPVNAASVRLRVFKQISENVDQPQKANKESCVLSLYCSLLWISYCHLVPMGTVCFCPKYEFINVCLSPST